MANFSRWASMSPHLDALLDLPESERERYLGLLETNDPELAHAIREFLTADQDPEFSRFMKSAPIEEPATLVGRRVGPYLIDAEVGRGGMGSVWRAHRADGRYEGTVAVKFVHASWIGGAGEQRFRIEGKLLAQLNHPNIARLIDAGVLEGAQPYLILEFVEGTPITAHCEEHALELRARITLFLDVLAAVSHAHSHLIVHRDIKPSNILVGEQGLKLLDFGIAKLLTSEEGLTKPGGFAFTPQYAAPEQVLGKPITTATDVYSLGCVLYELLTGRAPLEAQGASTAELIRTIVTQEPPRPSSVARVRGIGARALEGDLDNILAKALSKQPADRYVSAEALADDLRRFLTDQPVLARAYSPLYHLRKFVRRHRAGVAAGTAVALLLAAAALVTFLLKLEADRQRDAARFEARSAQSSNEFMSLMLLSEGGGNHGALTSTQRIELGAQMLERQYPDDPDFAARMLVQLSRELIGEDKTRQIVDLDMRAYRYGRQAKDPEVMALAQCVAAYAEGNAGIIDRAPERVAEARRLLTEVREPAILIQVDCDQAESELAFRQGDAPKAERILREAMQRMEHAGETYRSAYVSVINDLCDLLNQQSRYSEAFTLTRYAEQAQVRFGRGGTVARLTEIQNQAVLLANMGEIREGLALLGDVRRRREAIQSAASEPLSLAVVYAAMSVRGGQLQSGIDLAQATAERARAAGNAFWYAAALGTVCLAYVEQGKLEDASTVLQQIESSQSGSGGVSAYLKGVLPHYRAAIALRRGDALAALASAKEALKALGADAGDKSEDSRESLDLAARAELQLSRVADAAVDARHALEIAEAAMRGPDTSGDVGEALLVLAQVRLAEGHSEEASPLLARAARCLANGLGPGHPLTRQALELQGRLAADHG